MRRAGLALVVLTVAVAHILWPNRATVDWPTVALLGIFISIVCWPEIASMIPLVKRLKLGSAEIELRETAAKLHQSVEKAEDAIGVLIKLPTVTTKRSFTTDSLPESLDRLATENSILDLASRDKELAVVRLAIEIEKELYSLYDKPDPTRKPPRTIREKVGELVSDHIIDKQLGVAIIEFGNVRNRVIHPSQVGVVDQATLASAIDSGIRILRLLRSARSLVS